MQFFSDLNFDMCSHTSIFDYCVSNTILEFKCVFLGNSEIWGIHYFFWETFSEEGDDVAFFSSKQKKCRKPSLACPIKDPPPTVSSELVSPAILLISIVPCGVNFLFFPPRVKKPIAKRKKEKREP